MRLRLPTGRTRQALNWSLATIFVLALTWWITSDAEHHVGAVRVVAAVVILLAAAAIDERVSSRLWAGDFSEHRWVGALVSASIFVLGIVAYAFLLGAQKSLAGVIAGTALGRFLGAGRGRERRSRSDTVPLWGREGAVDASEDGRRGRTGSPR